MNGTGTTLTGLVTSGLVIAVGRLDMIEQWLRIGSLAFGCGAALVTMVVGIMAIARRKRE